jgi:hypothetical protein
MKARLLALFALLSGLVLPVPAAGQGVVDGLLGSSCDSDPDCTAGLSCVTASSNVLGGRGVARGVCTAGCNTDADCAPWQLLFQLVPVCADVQGTKICLEFCPVGATFTFLDKCHRREDLGCQKIDGRPFLYAQPQGGCTPLCSSDSQCGGRYCNRALGLCQDEPTLGDPVGSSCDPEASAPTCAGFCDAGQVGSAGAGGQTNTATCSELCVVGGPVGCGWSGEGVPRSACKTPDRGTVHPSLAEGDLSRCSQLCNCDADCSAKSSVCEPGGGSYHAVGTCVPAALAKDHISDCPVMGELGECVDGDVQACNGVGDCLGTATCLDDKSGYGKCECVDPGLAQGGEGPGGAAAGGAGGADSLAGAESLGGSAGGVADRDGTRPSPSGKTPEPGCSCSVPPVTSGFGWLTLALASGLFVRSRLRRHRR